MDALLDCFILIDFGKALALPCFAALFWRSGCMDSYAFLEKYQDRVLAQVLLQEQLITEETLQQAAKEKAKSTEPFSLGQWLIRQRFLKIADYTKAMAVVQKQVAMHQQKEQTQKNRKCAIQASSISLSTWKQAAIFSCYEQSLEYTSSSIAHCIPRNTAGEYGSA